MKILIVKLSAFGDIIHSLPALDDILQHPDVDQVHWLVDQRYGFVTEVFPAAVQVHRVALKGAHPVVSVWQTIRKLRAIGFDAIIDLQGLIKSAAMARACGSPVYNFDKKVLREKAASLLTQCVPFHPDERHVVQQYRRIAAAIFDERILSEAPSTAIPYRSPAIDLEKSNCTTDSTLLGRLQLEKNNYVILHAAGGWETKQLPETTWLTIADDLKNRGITPLFSWGSDAEALQAKSLAARSNAYALPERLNMSALCTLIKGAKAVVGADTGLLHLAAALNRTTITFWGPSASWRSAPISTDQDDITQGARHWHIESNPECGPCFKRTCNQFVCMDAIRPESILRILHEL